MEDVEELVKTLESLSVRVKRLARWARLQREFAEQMAAWAERYRQFADTMAVLLTPLPEAFRRAAHFLEAHPDDDPHQDRG
jgi:hypothetical protein